MISERCNRAATSTLVLKLACEKFIRRLPLGAAFPLGIHRSNAAASTFPWVPRAQYGRLPSLISVLADGHAATAVRHRCDHAAGGDHTCAPILYDGCSGGDGTLRSNFADHPTSHRPL